MFLDLDDRRPESLALKDNEGGAVTYRQLCVLAGEIGAHAEPRSVVFMLCRNTVGSVAGYLGFVDRGAVPVTLSSGIDGVLLENLMAVYTPAYIWCPDPMAGRFPYPAVYAAAGYSLLKTGCALYPLHPELQLCMTTSGSTGSPKLVRYKKGNLEANAKNVAAAFGWTARERSICDLAMNYTMGLNIINSHLSVGATCLLTTYNLTSAAFWDWIKTEKGTNFCGVPFSYDILKRLHFERMELPCLTTITEGGGKLTDQRFIELAEYAEKNGKRFIASFGTTETAARIAVLPADMARSKVGSIGKAIPEGELFLVGPDGETITEPAAEGELCYRGPNVTMGYAVCREDLARGDVFGGVYHTGDLARRDEDGYYYITGRMSRFLKLLSYRVSLDQCEDLIKQEFGIECACAGSDERMNIYIEDASKKADVERFIPAKTGLFKTLFKVIVVPGILRNESGKVNYKRMDGQYGSP